MHCLLPIQERRRRHARPEIVGRLRRLRQGRWFPRSRLVRRWARLIMMSRSRMYVSSTVRGWGLDCEERVVVHFWLSIIILEVGNFLHHISRFTSGFIIGFTNVWQINLVTLSILPFIVAAGAIYTFVSTSIIIRVRKSYVQAGEIAQEVIGNVRTVQAFSAEERAVKVYLESLLTTYKYGRKAGLAKGLGIGTLHFVIYLSRALLVWFTSIIVHKNISNGADAFSTMLNVVFAGLSLGQAALDITSFIQAKAAAYPIF